MTTTGERRVRRRASVLELYLAWERVILGALVIVVVLTAWEGLNRGWWADLLQPLLGAGAERLRIRPIFVSSPTLVAQAAWRLYVVTGEIWPHLATSALEYVVGIAFAIAIGVPFGLVAGWYRRASYVVEPFITALNATPQVAFLPLLVIWIGTGFTTRVTIIFLLSVLPILIASMAAVRTLDRRFLKLAQSFAAPQWHTFLHLVLPSSVPFILGGVRLAIGRAMIGIVVGELYGAAIGLGLFINRAGSLFQTDKVFVGVITIIAAGLVLTGLLRRIERRFDAWRPTVGGA